MFINKNEYNTLLNKLDVINTNVRNLEQRVDYLENGLNLIDKELRDLNENHLTVLFDDIDNIKSSCSVTNSNILTIKNDLNTLYDYIENNDEEYDMCECCEDKDDCKEYQNNKTDDTDNVNEEYVLNMLNTLEELNKRYEKQKENNKKESKTYKTRTYTFSVNDLVNKLNRLLNI